MNLTSETDTGQTSDSLANGKDLRSHEALLDGLTRAVQDCVSL